MFSDNRSHPASCAGVVFSLAVVRLLLASLLVFQAGQLQADLPVARLWTVFPPGGSVGSEFEVSVNGVDLDDPDFLWFSHPAIKGKAKAVGESERTNNRKFSVKIEDSVPSGFYEVRFVGRFGVSNPRIFHVSRQNELPLNGGEGSVDSPKPVKTGSIVSGIVSAGSKVHFKVAARKGEPLRFLCYGPELDSRLEPVLSLRDARGRELAFSRRGGWLELIPKEDAEVFLALHDLTFRGGEEYFYRLWFGANSIVDHLVPSAIRSEEETAVQIFGRALPGGKPTGIRTADGYELQSVSLKFKPEASPRVVGPARIYRLSNAFPVPEDAYLLPSLNMPVWLGLSDIPVISEQGGNSSKTARTVPFPCEISGMFDGKNDRFWFVVEARKGQMIQFDVFSQRLGAPTDPFLVVQRLNATGGVAEEKEFSDQDGNIGGLDFPTSTRDPSGRFEVKEDCKLRICVRNLSAPVIGGNSPVFRLRMRQETPEFSLLAAPLPPPPPNKDTRLGTVWTTHLRRGERRPVQVFVARTGGLTNSVELHLEGAPKGLRAYPAVIPPDRSSGWLMVEAAADAPAGVGAIKISGSLVGSTNKKTRLASAGTVVWNVGDANNERIWPRLSTTLAVSVSGNELTPLGISVTNSGPFEVKVGGKLQIPFQLERSAPYDRAVKVRPVGFAQLDPAKEFESAAKTNHGSFELDLGQVKLAAGDHEIYLEASGTGAYKRVTPEEVAVAESKLKSAEASLKDKESELKKAKDAAAVPGAREGEALKARVQELEKAKDGVAAEIKRLQELVKPSDVSCRAWSRPISIKVIP